MTTPPSKTVRALFADVRARNPRRPVTYGEAIQVARRQAEHVRRWCVDFMPPRDELAINLIWLKDQKVVPVAFAPSYMLREKSGLTTDRIGGQLRIFVNDNEPRKRQRFSLLHEAKHAIDFYDVDVLYAKLGQGDQELRRRLIERLADEFAAYVLMPTMQVRREWVACQNVHVLAKRFDVSAEAMNTRLEKLGLIDRQVPESRTYFREAGFTIGSFDAELLATA
jgi:hypothetical protein